LKAKRGLLEMNTERDKVEAINQCMSLEEVVSFRRQSAQVKASDSLLGWLHETGVNGTECDDERGYLLTGKRDLKMLHLDRSY
jgi:hypothetical protein